MRVKARVIAAAEVHVGVAGQPQFSAAYQIGLRWVLGSPLLVEISTVTEPALVILDKSRQVTAFLPGVSLNYTRRINEATEISVALPRQVVDDNIPAGHDLRGFFTESKAQYAEIAAFVQVYTGKRLKCSGKINRRTLGELVTIQAYTEEILLERNITPAQYGKVWDGWDIADVARDLLDGWQTVRVKDQQQWQVYMIDSSNVDLTTEPGTVMLAKRSNGRYYESGYITLAFSAGEIPKFKQWDRIRWSADSGDVVRTTVQYSTGGVWSEEFDGGLPEEIGLVPNFGSEENVYVRINLYTNDTASEDPNGNPVGVTPVVFAVELIARTVGELVVGNIPDTTGVAVLGISADRASALEVLREVCEQVGWEFNVWNGALNVAQSLGVDRTSDFVLRAGTNMAITSLGDDDEELCNILTAYGPGQGINRLEIVLRDEDSIREYGDYPVPVEFPAESLAKLQLQAEAYLSAHNSPKTNFAVSAVFDLDHEPNYGLGDQVRVADPEAGIVTTTRIMSESRRYDGKGLSVSLDLGKAALNLQSALEGDKPKRPTDPLQPSGVYARGVIKGIVVGCSTPKADWGYTECHVSTASGFTPSSSTLKSVGRQTRFDVMELDAGVRYYAQLVHVDSTGRKSEPSREVSAAAQYVPPEDIPDYSLGVEKFMENLKPPIMVTSLPVLPDSRYTVGTTVFLTVDKRLYSTDGNVWTPVGAGTVTADEIMAGIIEAGGISADYIKSGTITADKIVINGLTGFTIAQAEETAIAHTTSTAFVDMPGMSANLDITEDAKVLVLFQANVWNTASGRSVDTRILMDGVQYPAGLESRHTSAYADATGNNLGLAVVMPTTGLHNFKVQWQVTAGTGGVASRRLYVYQFKR